MPQVTKEELHKKVLDHKEELVSLCQDLIRIKNQSALDPQEPAVDFVRGYLASHGIDSQRLIAYAGEDYPVIYARIGSRGQPLWLGL